MKNLSICFSGLSCGHMFAPSVRVKKPGSRVRLQLFLQILLVVLLTGKVCNQTSTAPTTTSVTSVTYVLDVTVDITGQNNSRIEMWLTSVFKNMSGSCVSPALTTTLPIYTQTATATTSVTPSDNTTTATTSVTPSDNTTTATTSVTPSDNTTTATTSVTPSDNTTTATSVTPSDNTTTATTSVTPSDNTTTATSVTSSNNTTTATTSVTPSDNTTTATTSVTPSDNTTTATTSVTPSDNTTTATSVTPNNNTTTATTSVTLSNNTTTATTLESSNTTASPTSVTPNDNTTTTLVTPSNNTPTTTTSVTPSNNTPTTTTSVTPSNNTPTTTTSATLSNNTPTTTTSLTPSNNTPTTTTSVTPTTTTSVTLSNKTPTTTTSVTPKTTTSVTPSNNTPTTTTSVTPTTTTSVTPSNNTPTTTTSVTPTTRTSVTPSNNTTTTRTSVTPSNNTPTTRTSVTPSNNTPTTRTSVTPSNNTPTTTTSRPSSVNHSVGSSTQNRNRRAVRETGNNMRQIRDLSIDTKTGLFQSVALSPTTNTEYTVTLTLTRTVPACCILRTLCAASNNSTDIHVVGNKVYLDQPQNSCNSSQENSCSYTGPANNSCAESGAAYVAAPTNTSTCDPAQPTTAVTITTLSTNTTGSGSQNSAENQANALLDMTSDVSKLNSSQVDALVSLLESLLSGPNVSLALGNTSIHIISNLLGASPTTLARSSNRIIGIVDTVGLKLVLGNAAQTLLSPSVALSVKPADGSNFQETFFSISNPSNVQISGNSRLRRSVTTGSSIPQGSVTLPSSLTQNLSSSQQQLATRVQFNFYQKSTVFQDKSLGTRRLISGILGASVANLSITGLKDNVVISLRNTEPIPGNYVATCVFWDFTLNNRSGGWNPNGCVLQNSTDNETTCGCNHLTSFAILLDLSRQSTVSPLQATVLSFITYIGCGISAIFLAVTVLTYLMFEKLRRDIPSKILIHLCTALLLLNLVFLVDAWLALYTDAVGLCIATAWFLHYFLLVSFTWMGLEAVHMYNAIVKVFNYHMSRYMLKFSVAGWGIPIIVVVIVIAVDKNNYGLVSYGKFTDGQSDDFCWLKNDIAFYVAVVAYFCAIFLFNVIMFIVVLVQLCRIKRQNPHNARHHSTLVNVRSVAGITVLLGLTWGFAFFAWGPVNLPFMYLFAIFNSLQGFFIFVFYCAVKENVKRQWRAYMCCGRMRVADNSDWSRTATQKTTNKSSVSKQKSVHASNASQSNSSSSSTSFLVTESSEQISGISSPFEDRVITADEEPRMDVILNEINMRYRNQQAS